jgi:UDP-glucose 4-epimerase
MELRRLFDGTEVKAEMKILVVGGAGYIGSHVVEALLESGVDPRSVFIFDNFSTGHRAFCPKRLPAENIIECDLRNLNETINALVYVKPDVVMHLAAKISVGESVQKPKEYLENNYTGTLNLLEAMKAANCKKIVFSSTAAVYGSPKQIPIEENADLNPVNPYGESKLLSEVAIQNAGREWSLSSVIFRYFNASGASDSGLIGEWHEPETHLIPLAIRAARNGTELNVFGDDYETIDGTCIRDYIHVSDIAKAHVLGVKFMRSGMASSDVFNLGSNNGYSVKQVIRVVETVTGKNANVRILPRREGDAPILTASMHHAQTTLSWTPIRSGLENIVRSADRWEFLQRAFQ